MHGILPEAVGSGKRQVVFRCKNHTFVHTIVTSLEGNQLVGQKHGVSYFCSYNHQVYRGELAGRTKTRGFLLFLSGRCAPLALFY
jgi:hypothetical protein